MSNRIITSTSYTEFYKHTSVTKNTKLNTLLLKPTAATVIAISCYPKLNGHTNNTVYKPEVHHYQEVLGYDAEEKQLYTQSTSSSALFVKLLKTQKHKMFK